MLKRRTHCSDQVAITRVVQVHPGQDKRVQVVIVCTARGTYKSPIVKVVLLLYSDDQEQ